MACGQPGSSTAPDTVDTLTDTTVASIVPDTLKLEDSLLVPAFDLKLDLSSNAKYLLTTGEEGLLVDVSCFGVPKADLNLEGKSYYNEEEALIYVSQGVFKYQVNEAGKMTIEGLKMERTAFEQLADPNYQVNINVYGARKSSPNNVFRADAVEHPIKTLTSKETLLEVDLL